MPDHLTPATESKVSDCRQGRGRKVSAGGTVSDVDRLGKELATTCLYRVATMKLAACPLVLAGILLGSSAVLVGARLGTEKNNAVDNESEAAKHDSQQRWQLTPRRLDVLDKMFSSMIEDAGRVMDQLDEYMPSTSSSTTDKGDFDMSSMMDLMGDADLDFAKIMDTMMQPVNFTDIYDRCCGSNATVMIGTTQYDATNGDSCNCPVRNVAPFEAKWDDKCITSVGPKALMEINGESTPKTGMELFLEAMGGKMGDKMGGDFDFGSMMGGDMSGGFGDAFGEIMESIFGPVDWVDIQQRCCSDDISDCNCPVRNNTKFLAKWEEQCETKIAMKAAEQKNGGETDGSGSGFDLGDMMGDGDLDLESLFEAFFGKSVNYTQVYDNCCDSDGDLFLTAYSSDPSACKCPVRQTNPKWETAFSDKIIPKLLEE